MPNARRDSQGPAVFKGGRVYVEQELGLKDGNMMNPEGTNGSGVPEHNAGGKFGGNLVENDKTIHYNPGDRASPGVPTQVSHRFGNDPMLPDKTPALNPDK